MIELLSPTSDTRLRTESPLSSKDVQSQSGRGGNEDNLNEKDLHPFPRTAFYLITPIFCDRIPICGRFQPCWDDGSIAGIEIDFQEYKVAVQAEKLLAALGKCDDVNTSFDKGWRLVQCRLIYLHDFCGGIGKAYLNTRNVESDFSILRMTRECHSPICC